MGISDNLYPQKLCCPNNFLPPPQQGLWEGQFRQGSSNKDLKAALPVIAEFEATLLIIRLVVFVTGVYASVTPVALKAGSSNRPRKS